MSYNLNLAEYSDYFDSMPVPFVIIEMVYDSQQQPVDFIFRYANQAFADLEEQPIEQIVNRRFCQELFPNEHSKKWIPYYDASASQGKIYELHEYSEEIQKYLKIFAYPWKEKGFCACIVFNETEFVQKGIQLDYLASYDTMTQTLNQNSYQEFLKNFQPGQPLGILFIDINSLKQMNDTFGHQTGDFLIKLVTDRINQVVHNDHSRIFRIGGDEFLIVVENCTQEEILQTAELLQQALRNQEFPHLPEILASVGTGWTASNTNIEGLIKEADQDMYVKKKSYYRLNEQSNEKKQCRLWKESYRLGVDHIDEQHMQLFKMTEELLEAISRSAGSEEYSKILTFLKDYVVFHFRDEEKYQASIHYPDLKDHQKAHRDFTQTVLSYEKQLLENNFDQETMKKLAGTLTAWLIYHVAGTDKKIVSNGEEASSNSLFAQCVNVFAESMIEVLEKIGGFERNDLYFHTVSKQEHPENILYHVKLEGDIQCDVFFSFSHGVILHLIRTMIMISNPELNELARSAVSQIVTIACEGTLQMLNSRDIHCKIDMIGSVSGEPIDKVVIGSAIETGAGCIDILACE